MIIHLPAIKNIIVRKLIKFRIREENHILDLIYMLDLFHENIWENIILYFDIQNVSSLRLCDKLIKEKIDLVLRNSKTVFHIQRKDDNQTLDYFVHFFLGRHGKFIRNEREEELIEGYYNSNDMIGTWISKRKDVETMIETYFNGDETIEIYQAKNENYESIIYTQNDKMKHHAIYQDNEKRSNIVHYRDNDNISHTYRYIFKNGNLCKVIVVIRKGRIVLDKKEYIVPKN